MSDATAIGKLIRESRLAKGMSLGQLASEVGRSSSSVRRWERGEVPPAIAVIPALAEALDVEPDRLGATQEPELEGDADAGEPEPKRSTTVEQPIVSQSTGSQPVATEQAKATETVPQPDGGLVRDVMSAVQSVVAPWSGWIRGVLTAVVLLAMLLVLLWAASELLEALREVWRSFDSGGTASSGT